MNAGKLAMRSSCRIVDSIVAQTLLLPGKKPDTRVTPLFPHFRLKEKSVTDSLPPPPPPHF